MGAVVPAVIATASGAISGTFDRGHLTPDNGLPRHMGRTLLLLILKLEFHDCHFRHAEVRPLAGVLAAHLKLIKDLLFLHSVLEHRVGAKISLLLLLLTNHVSLTFNLLFGKSPFLGHELSFKRLPDTFVVRGVVETALTDLGEVFSEAW